MAKKNAVNFVNYDFEKNPDNYTFDEITTIRRMIAANEPIYLAPIKIEIPEQLENLHTSYKHCKTWRIGSEKITVKLTPTNGALYDVMVRILWTEHREGIRSTRCVVPGKYGTIRCDEHNRCKDCPYCRNPD